MQHDSFTLGKRRDFSNLVTGKEYKSREPETLVVSTEVLTKHHTNISYQE
jgi:hypothetical protein